MDPTSLANRLTDDDRENGKQQYEYLRELVADADGVLQKIRYFRQKAKNTTVSLLKEADEILKANETKHS